MPTCQDCGKPYPFPLDVTLPNDQWALIAPDDELLCETCILIRAAKMPGVVAARMWIDQLDIGEDRKRHWVGGHWDGEKPVGGYDIDFAAGIEQAASACAARAERHAQAAERLLPGSASREFIVLRGEAAACERVIRALAAPPESRRD